MYCYKCGREIPEDANVCPYCGVEQQHNEVRYEKAIINQDYNIFALLGLISSLLSVISGINFFAAIGGLILSIIGLNQIHKQNQRGKGCAITGIIISIIVIVINIIIIGFGFSLFFSIFDVYEELLELPFY